MSEKRGPGSGAAPRRRGGEGTGAELARAAAIAETAPDALLLVDRDGHLVFVNRRVEELFGYRREDLLGAPLEKLLPERYRAGHDRHLRRFFARPQVRSMGSGLELYGRRADGSEFPVEISLSPIRIGGETLVASAVRDASERRDIERRLREARARAEAATAQKTRFIAAASHDLRQPLQAAAIYLDLLSDGALGLEAMRATAGKARQCVDSLRELLDKVLHISKLDAGAVLPHPTDIPVQRLFDRLAAQYGPLARAKGLDLRLRATGESAHSDPILSGQILENLVSNAIRYTAAGRVLVGCRRRGGSLRLQVWDTGVGIAEEDREKIFRAFYRAGGAQEQAGTVGIGLGLAIAGRLAALLDHPIEVRSRPGRGSLFELVLPRADREPAVPPPRVPAATGPRHAFLAVLDDNPAIVDALRSVLEVAGNRVVADTTTEGLLAQLRRAGEPPAALITDYRLAGEDRGLEALARVRSEFGDSIPAIVLTGDSSFEGLQLEAASGGFQALAKPVDARQLLAAIGRCLAVDAGGGDDEIPASG